MLARNRRQVEMLRVLEDVFSDWRAADEAPALLTFGELYLSAVEAVEAGGSSAALVRLAAACCALAESLPRVD